MKRTSAAGAGHEGVIWSVVATMLSVKLIGVAGGLRVSPVDEEEGLDESAHGEKAYHV